MKKTEREQIGEWELTAEIKELLEPAQSAVLLIDFQEGYFAPSLGMPITWTRMIEDPDLSVKTGQMKMKTSGYGTITKPGENSFEYFQIGPKKVDLEVIKNNFDAFTSAELEKVLKEQGVSTLVVAGANTGVCVESTVCSAQSKDLLFGWVTKSDTINETWKEHLQPKLEF